MQSCLENILGVGEGQVGVLQKGRLERAYFSFQFSLSKDLLSTMFLFACLFFFNRGEVVVISRNDVKDSCM